MKNRTLPSDPEKMNTDRAKRAHDMMQEFWHVTDDVPEHPFAEILCDFMHWADRNGIHFDDSLARARAYYSLETCEMHRHLRRSLERHRGREEQSDADCRRCTSIGTQ